MSLVFPVVVDVGIGVSFVVDSSLLWMLLVSLVDVLRVFSVLIAVQFFFVF